MIIYAADSNKILIDKITEEIAKKSVADMSQRFFLIVPEKFSVSMEKLMLLKSKRKALTNVQVTTLSRLLHKLNDGTKNYIPKQTGVMIVKKIILDNYDKLVCYKKTARTMGFAEKIYDTISELKNSKVSPLDYLKQRSGLTTTLNIKLQDIFLIYSEYEKFITTNKLIDACDRFELLSSLILSSDKLRGSYVYVLGFDSVTSAGLSVFESIAKVSKQTTFACLDNSGKANSYICRPEMLENYKDMAKRLGVSPTIVSLRYPKLSMAQHICNNVYSYPYSRIKTTDEVILFETKTVIEEIELLAENIRRRVIEDGLRYNEIAIVCPDVDGYQNIIKNTFADYKIPFFIDSAEPLANHPLVIFLENCLNCIRKNFSVDEFMLVASSYFSGLTTKEVSCLDNFLVKYGVNYDKLKEPFNKALKQSWEENDSLSERARSVVANALLPAYNALIKSKKVSCHIDVVKSLFDSFCLNDKVEDFIELLKREKNHVLSDATKQVREKVINLLSEIERIFGKQEMPFDEFFAIFQSGIQGEKISLVPIAVDMVFVGDISTSKFFDVKDLYIIGAVDGSVPKIKDDCGIIVDKEVNMLSDNLGKKIEPTIRTINQREKFKLVNILQEFSERLYISYSKLSRSGEQQQPSSIIREISKIFYRVDSSKSLEVLNASRMDKLRSLLSEKDLVSSYAYEYATKEVGLKKLLTSVSEDSSNKESMKDVAISSLYNVLKKDKQINVEACLTPRKDRVLSEPKQLFFNTGKTSVSQIECYYSCPFRYFASYGLRVRPREEAYLKSIDFGNVLHKIAELYIKNINKFEKLSRLSTKEEMQKEIEKLIDFVFNQEKIKQATNKHSLILLKSEAIRMIDALTYQYKESNFKPVAQELEFGNTGAVPAVKLSQQVRLEGKIDRVDVCGNYFRVIDYKTGQIDLSPKMVYYGLKLQLFTYLNAMRGFNGLRPAGVFYLPIRNVFVDEQEVQVHHSIYKLQGYFNKRAEVLKNMDRRLSPESSKSTLANITVSSSKERKIDGDLVAIGNNAFSEAELDILGKYTKNLCQTAVDEILSGYIKPSPIEHDGKTTCDMCDFKYICGRNFYTNEGVRKARGNIKFDNFAKEEAYGKETK